MLYDPDAEELARTFHEAYERLAPDYGYKTREASAVAWEDVPAQNKALMVATAGAVLMHYARKPAEEPSVYGSAWVMPG